VADGSKRGIAKRCQGGLIGVIYHHGNVEGMCESKQSQKVMSDIDQKLESVTSPNFF
jgi:hypothetical protein